MARLNTRMTQSFIVSLVIHGVILFILGIYLVTQTQQFQDLIDASILKAADPPKPKVRKPVIKPIIKPTVPMQSPVVVEQVQPTPRVTTAVMRRATLFPTLLQAIPIGLAEQPKTNSSVFIPARSIREPSS